MNVLMLRYSGYWSPPVVRRADRVYCVLETSEAARVSPGELAALAGVYTVTSFDSLEELSAVAADLLVRDVVIDRVASPTEHTQYAAGYLAQLLRIPRFSPRLALATRDKRVMKELVREEKVEVARSVSLPDAGRGADLAQIERTVGFPLVLKPANGWGTSATVRVDDRDGLRAALDDYGFEPDHYSHHLIAEEFIDGEEFHVDAVWRDGEPWVFCVSRTFEPKLQAWTSGGLNGAILLAEEDHPQLYADMLDVHRRVIRAVGQESGVTHVELFRERGTGRLVFGEIAARLGGACIVETVGARCGVDQREIAAHELLGGQVENLALGTGSVRYSGWLSLSPSSSGRITALPDRDRLLEHPHVVNALFVQSVGDVIEAGPSAWCVLIVLGGDSEDELTESAAQLVSDFRIQVA